MNYRTNPQNGDDLSILGYGCMRFPTTHGSVNVALATEHIRNAVESGVNYFDTAYIYHMGKSESILGQALLGGYRERVKIATKLPPFMVRTPDDIEKIFSTQLKRLQTDHIDYYLIHMLMNTKTLEGMKQLGLYEWIRKKKDSGEIRNIGFSFHGKASDFIELVDAYPWEFCQIQYNYLDENNQAGKAGLQYAAKKNLPVIIMEPLRGGRLVTHLPDDVKTLFGDNSPVDMALRWIWSHPEATVVLSGMSTQEQITQNIEFASSQRATTLTGEESAMFDRVKEVLLAKTKVPCTACAYCMPCPAGVDIPACFSAYNDRYLLKHSPWRFRPGTMNYARDTGAFSDSPGNASLCRQCGKCESHCPQSIPIREVLSRVKDEMEGSIFKIYRMLGRRFLQK